MQVYLGAISAVLANPDISTLTSGQWNPAKIASGSFNPGQDGDFYMDLTKNRLYGPRATGNWPVKSWPFGVPD